MKKLIAVLLLAALSLAVFSGCTSKTPDVVASEAANVTVENVTWSIPVEIDGADATTYTIEQAKAHDLAKTYASFRYMATEADPTPQVTTAIFEGVLFREFLADIGYPEAQSVSIYHTNTSYYKVPFEFDYDMIHSDNSLLAWIQNKNDVIKNSETHVAFASKDGGVNDVCHSIAKIVVHP